MSNASRGGDKEAASSSNEKGVKLHLHMRMRPEDDGLASSSDNKMVNEATPYDLQAISQSIQRVARATAPIGRVMDYLPTERNAMMKERDYWRDEYERQHKEFVKMKKKTEIELQPLQAQIKSTEDEIERMKELVFKKKAKIAKNEEWIEGHIRRICQL